MTHKRQPPRSGGGKAKQTEAENTFSGKVDASADESHASLMERAASVLSQSIFRNRLTSPEVCTLEEALRVLMLDGAAFHRFRANHYRKHAGFLFQDQKVA